MAAFDLNNLYFIKGNAPKTSSYEELMQAGENGFNLGKSAKEQYDKNSLQALIAQREKEGVPYYLLGNESAKWDLGAAQGMDRDRMGRIKFDYEMQKDEFETWRKNMARRICGQILQLANDMQMPEEDLASVLYTAYTYVVTYDGDLANQLLMQYKSITSAKAKANKPGAAPKPVDLWTTAQTAKKEAMTYDPKFNAPQYWGLMNYAVAAEAVAAREQMIKANTGEFVPAQKNDVLRLLSNFKNRDKEISKESMLDYALSDKFHLIYENEGSEENQDFSGIVSPTEIQEGVGNGAVPSSTVTPKAKSQANGSEGASENVGGGSFAVKSMLDPASIKRGNPEISSKLFRDQFRAADKIDDVDKAIEAFEDIRTQLTQDSTDANKGSGKNEGADKRYQEMVNDKIESLEKIKNEMGSSDAARLMWKNLPARAKLADARRFRQAGTFAANMLSVNPYSSVDNGLQVASPDYQVSEAMQKASSNLATGKWDTDVINAFAQSGNSFFNQLAKKKTGYEVLEALGINVVNTMRPIYNELMRSCKNDTEREKIKSFLRSSYGWPEELFLAIEHNGSLGTADRLKKASQKMASNPSVEFVDGKAYVGGKEMTIDEYKKSHAGDSSVKGNDQISSLEDIE